MRIGREPSFGCKIFLVSLHWVHQILDVIWNRFTLAFSYETFPLRAHTLSFRTRPSCRQLEISNIAGKCGQSEPFRTTTSLTRSSSIITVSKMPYEAKSPPYPTNIPATIHCRLKSQTENERNLFQTSVALLKLWKIYFSTACPLSSGTVIENMLEARNELHATYQRWVNPM